MVITICQYKYIEKSMSSLASLEWECFLTHDWGIKEDEYYNHKRVVGEVCHIAFEELARFND